MSLLNDMWLAEQQFIAREKRRKELSEMLDENDFDIDSFIDYKPNFKHMRQIKFDPALIGKPGITVKVDGEVPHTISWFGKRVDYQIAVIKQDGTAINYRINEGKLTMYRQTRSAEDIAKEVCEIYNSPFSTWQPNSHKMFTALVQAGLDEMKGGEE